LAPAVHGRAFHIRRGRLWSRRGSVVNFSYLDLPDSRSDYGGLWEFLRSILQRWHEGIYRTSGSAEISTDFGALAALRRDEDGPGVDVAGLVKRLAYGGKTEWGDALYLLRTRAYPDAVPALIAAVADPSAKRRTYAAELLGGIGGPGAAEALRNVAAGDPDDLVRRKAAAALRDLDS
jgi:hypothetical protein